MIWKVPLTLAILACAPAALASCSPAPVTGDDRANAARMHIHVDAYVAAKQLIDEAHTDCLVEAAAHTTPDAKVSGGADYTWKANGEMLILSGSDLMLQSSSGAVVPVRYSCVWNMRSQTVTSNKID
jgi:hypothetical protein